MKDLNRKKLFKRVNRIVIKVGSGVLTRHNGLDLNVIEDLAGEICSLRRKGIQVILVSSGAIAAGLRKIGISKRPDSPSQMQALAAMGQSSLIKVYEEAFARHRTQIAQILLTKDDLTNRQRFLNARNTLFTLLSWKVVPIINENDTVTAEEIKFGDNDNLSAMVTNLSGSQLLINLTNIDGVYDKDPRTNTDAEKIDVVDKIDRKIVKAASSIPGFLGSGGMSSKITAAKQVALSGHPTVIANGRQRGILKDIFSGKDVGTLFLPEQSGLSSKKQWIAFTKSPKGEVTIDRGAVKALVKKGKSLLPSGIKSVKGRFSIGDSVLLLGPDGEEVAVGMVNYNSTDLARIIGVNTCEIEGILGCKQDDEVIHRDNLVLKEQLSG